MTLHDIETLERIGNQLQVSERLAALGRVTAGVAHEVKNPLNSMRLVARSSEGQHAHRSRAAASREDAR